MRIEIEQINDLWEYHVFKNGKCLHAMNCYSDIKTCMKDAAIVAHLLLTTK